MRGFYGLFVLCMLIGLSVQLGTVYLDSIQSNLDPITGATEVRIEGTIWDDSTTTLDFIEGRESPGTGPGFGVSLEDSINNEGSTTIPEDLSVEGRMTVDGLLKPNGGIIADDGDADDDGATFSYSWRLFDDSGDLHIVGSLAANGGINVDNQFLVEDDTGRTFINGLTRPDGGINVNTDEFVIDPASGELFSQGSGNVELDIFFGNTLPEVRTVGRPNLGIQNPTFAETTIISGQAGAVTGGDIALSPGVAIGPSANSAVGLLILGNEDRGTEVFEAMRQPVEGPGGETIFSGQDSAARGGDIVLQAGIGTNGMDGGNIVLSTGSALSESDFGVLLLGGKSFEGDNNQRDAFDYIATRPLLAEGGDAGSTFFVGQSTNFDNAAASSFVGGDGETAGGNVAFAPGFNADTNVQGTLWFGRNVDVSDSITVARQVTEAAEDGGDTFLMAQHSTMDDGGSLFIQAGDAPIAAPAGNLFLETGIPLGGGDAGIIAWGRTTDDLVVGRTVATTGAATETVISGQEGPAGNGGELVFTAGSGSLGGDVFLVASDGVQGGGSVIVTAADGVDGGNVDIVAADGTSSGGWVSIQAGLGGITSSAAADVTFVAGTAAATPGSVEVTAETLRLDAIDFSHNAAGGTFELNDAASGGVLVLSTDDANGFFVIDGDGLIGPRITNFANVDFVRTTLDRVVPINNLAAAVTELALVFNELVNGLDTVHGLVTAV